MKYCPEVVSAMLATIYDHATSAHKDSWEAAAWLLYARHNSWIGSSVFGPDSEKIWSDIEKIARSGYDSEVRDAE